MKRARRILLGSLIVSVACACYTAPARAQGLTPTLATDEQKSAFVGTAELLGKLEWSDGSAAANETFDLLGYDSQYKHLKIREIRTDAAGRYHIKGLRGEGTRYRLWLTSDPNQRTFYIDMKGEGTAVEYDYRYQPRLGDPAPMHVMTGLDGNEVVLKDFLGKVVVLKFWAVWCAPCHPGMKETGEILRRRADWKDDVVVVAVNADPRKSTVEKFIRENGLQDMVHLFVAGQHWEPLRDGPFHVNSIPFNFVIDRKGTVRLRNELGEGIEQLVDRLIE